MSVTRNAFKLFVSIKDQFSPTDEMMERHKGYPIDNVIQIKLNKTAFTDLFKDTTMDQTTSGLLTSRYDAEQLLVRLGSFFEKGGANSFNNYNNLASDITILINNTFDDVDVNPVALETACEKDGEIWEYFFKSNTIHARDSSSIELEADTDEYGAIDPANNNKLKVYQVIARELDNMISRNIFSTSEDTIDEVADENYDDLDVLYSNLANAFWDNLTVGDSIFIEGSFKVPTAQATPAYVESDGNGGSYNVIGSGNLPIILQFVHNDVETYNFTI